MENGETVTLQVVYRNGGIGRFYYSSCILFKTFPYNLERTQVVSPDPLRSVNFSAICIPYTMCWEYYKYDQGKRVVTSRNIGLRPTDDLPYNQERTLGVSSKLLRSCHFPAIYIPYNTMCCDYYNFD